jgi:hypothetical protein
MRPFESKFIRKAKRNLSICTIIITDRKYLLPNFHSYSLPNRPTKIKQKKLDAISMKRFLSPTCDILDGITVS